MCATNYHISRNLYYERKRRLTSFIENTEDLILTIDSLFDLQLYYRDMYSIYKTF